MTRLIVFLFIFPTLCFAKQTCKELGKNIQHLNSLQSKALNNDSTLEKILILEKSISFLAQMKNVKAEDDLTNTISKYTLESTSKEDMKMFAELYEKDCAENKKFTNTELIEKRFVSCLDNIKLLLGEKNQLVEKENKLKSDLAGLKKIIENSLKDPKVINLGIVKKSLAQKFLNMKCTEESSEKELSESLAYDYACRDQVHRPHTEGIKDFAEDNLDILLKLQLENNKVTDSDFKKSCDELLKDPELKKVLPSCPIGKIGGAVVSKVTKTDDKNTVVTDKIKDEFKNKDDRDPASKNKVVKEKLNPDSYKAQRARKRKKTWKTIGIVTAAVGATGLAVWGLSELFKPTPSTLEFTPHPNASRQNYTQSYDMNAYQQFMMYQNNQSNQNMMYQGNMYQGDMYGYGSNWVGYQESAATSPYSFEFGI